MTNSKTRKAAETLRATTILGSRRVSVFWVSPPSTTVVLKSGVGGAARVGGESEATEKAS